MKIWQVWCASDAAQSDSFFSSQKQAIDHVRETWVMINVWKRNEHGWLEANDVKGDTIYLRELVIARPTASYICAALKDWPNR